MNKLYILSAVPLATALSYDPHWGERSAKPEAAGQVALHEAQPSLGVAHAEDRNRLRTELEQRGLDAAAADRVIEQASLFNQLDPSGYLWQKGQRLTGALLVPDSAATICGFSNQPIWFFRTQMLDLTSNLECSARIHLSSNRSSRWTAMLAKPEAF